MAKTLRVLIVDDCEADARLMLSELRTGGFEVIWERVDTTEALTAALRCGAWDAILTELHLPHGGATIAILEEDAVDAPIIVVSRQVEEDVGVTAIRGRVNDFVSKRALARLCPALERELRSAEMQRRARQVEQAFRLGSEVATQLGEGVYLIKASDQTIAFTNPRFDEMFGYAPAELIGKHVSIVNAPMDKSPEEVAGQISGALHRDRRWQGEVCNRKKDGSVFWCHASVSTFDHPDFGPVWVAVHQDITERKQAEAALRESEERYRSLVNATAQMVWTTNAHGEVVSDCPSWRAFTGQSEQEIMGRGWLASLHPGDRKRADVGWAEAVERRREHEIEYRLRRHDGEYRDFVVRGVPVLAPDGTIREWVGTCTDITDLKRAREQLHTRQAELAHVLRVNTMGGMAAELAHEINQPLSAIASYAQGCRHLISAGSTPPDELLPAVEEIASQALRAGEILRRLRQLVQKQETPTQETDLNAVVTNAVHVLTPQARRLGIPIRVDLAPELPRITIDQIQIEQVVVNLMLNGIEAMQSDDIAQPELSVHTAYLGDATVEVSVRDGGIGLTPAISAKMFAPFYTTKPSGLGMGLSISRSIVERHGGKLLGTNNASGGATFHMALPVA